MSISDRVINCLNEWQNISSTCIRSSIDTIPSEKKILRTTVFQETEDFSEACIAGNLTVAAATVATVCIRPWYAILPD